MGPGHADHSSVCFLLALVVWEEDRAEHMHTPETRVAVYLALNHFLPVWSFVALYVLGGNLYTIEPSHSFMAEGLASFTAFVNKCPPHRLPTGPPKIPCPRASCGRPEKDLGPNFGSQ